MRCPRLLVNSERALPLLAGAIDLQAGVGTGGPCRARGIAVPGVSPMPTPLRTLALLMCISLCLAGRAFSVEFASPSAYAVGHSPQSVVVGDFNGDGKQDLAVLNTTSNTVSLLLGNGDGSFQAAKNFNCGNNPASLAVGDFNGDGKLD